MPVPHLRATGPEHFAARLLSPLDQPGVRGKFLHTIESADLMNLVEHRQRQHLPDAGHGPQAVKRVGIVLFRGAHEGQFEIVDEGVVPFEQRQVDFSALADAEVRKVVRDPISIRRIG